MEIKLDSLIAFEKIINELEVVFDIVDKNGKVVLLKDNRPAYIITKYDAREDALKKSPNFEVPRYTLHDAMKIVLSEQPDKTMHAADLADDIYNRGLYKQRDGNKAKYNQVRARCGNYPELFEALPNNIIKLREANK